MPMPSQSLMMRSLAVAALVMTAAPSIAERQGPLAGGPGPQLRMAQSPSITRDYLPGEWYTSNVERSQTVEIYWSVFRDGRLSYQFVINGASADGSKGTWTLDGDHLTEHWQRPFGLTGIGTAKVEAIDVNTMRLTIIDNGHPEYAGLVRIYRRVGGAQLSMHEHP